MNAQPAWMVEPVETSVASRTLSDIEPGLAGISGAKVAPKSRRFRHAMQSIAAQPPSSGLRNLFTTWSLRTRLVLLTALLLGVSLALVGIVTGGIVSQYLVQQVDEQLMRIAANPASLLNQSGPAGQPQGQPYGQRPNWGTDPETGYPGTDQVPSDYYLLWIDPDGTQHVSIWPQLQDRYGIPNITEVLPVNQPATLPGVTYAIDGSGNLATTNVGTDWRVIATTFRVGPPRDDSQYATLYVGLPLASVQQATSMLARTLVLAGITLIALGSLAALALVNRSLRPLRQMEQTAATIAAGDLTQRVPITEPSNTEVGSLTASLNVMLTQIEQAFAAQTATQERMRRFVSDASHELRTPLATIRGYSELYRMGALPESEVPATFNRIEDAARRMGTLVEELLTLARLDEGRPLRIAPVNLSGLVTEAAADLRALDPTRTITVSMPDDAVFISGDADRLRQVLTNLVGNVARHTPPGTPAELFLTTDGSEVSTPSVECPPQAGVSRPREATIRLVDHGPGITPDDEQRIFERFYRTDESRTRESGGNGLGLAIVAAIVGAHGGAVSASPTPGGGLTITLTFPKSDQM